MMSENARILIDATMIDVQGKGTSRYATNLIRSLGQIDDSNEYTIILNKNVDHPELPQVSNFSYVKVNPLPMLAWRLLKLQRVANRYACDVLHVLTEIAPLRNKVPLVITVHEIASIRNRLQGPGSIYDRLSRKLNEVVFPSSLRRADRLVAVSEATKKDLMQLHCINGSKIEVIPEAADDKFTNDFTKQEIETIRQQIDAEQGYVLSFASGDSRENNEVVLSAWDNALRSGLNDKKLIFAGCKDQTVRRKLQALSEQMDVTESVEILGYVDDSFLAKLYSAADAYVDMSFYEGFGLQVLEAMASKVPVICSNVPALAEVVGDAGILIEPTDCAGLTDAILRLLTDAKLRDESIKKGSRRVRDFSWRRAARQTLDVYESVLYTNKSLS